MLAAGAWQATASGDGRTAGYHLSSLYSPWVSWAEIAAEHAAAKEDPVRLKVWVNTKLAETWEERDGERLDADGLMLRREDWGTAVPAEVAVVTCGIDVQDDRLELEIVGWGRALAERRTSLSIPCYAERRYGGVADDELLMACPPDEFARGVDGLRELAKNGLRYPYPPYGAFADPSAGMSKSYGSR